MRTERAEINDGYLYDTHVHTSQGSACAQNTGSQMAAAYKRAGYAGIIITDHFFYGNTAVDRRLSWEEWVMRYCSGYEEARQTGDEIGLQVFFGWESGYDGTEFLIYGLDKEWLLCHPRIRDASIAEQYQMVKRDGGIVIQAHPYREADYISKIRLYPNDVDGVETINACHSNSRSNNHYNPDFDKMALNYASEHDFVMTAGSDMHHTDLLGGGMIFPTRLKNIHDFTNRILSRQKYTLTDGERIYTDNEVNAKKE